MVFVLFLSLIFTLIVIIYIFKKDKNDAKILNSLDELCKKIQSERETLRKD